MSKLEIIRIPTKVSNWFLADWPLMIEKKVLSTESIEISLYNLVIKVEMKFICRLCEYKFLLD